MPKVVDHEAYKKELLACSFEYFAAKGYGQVTMRQLAQHLGVSTGTLYHYFPGKEAIFEELMSFLAEQDWMIVSVLKSKGTLKKRVQALLELSLTQPDYIVKQITILLEYAQLHGFASLRKSPAVRRWYEKLSAFLREYLEIDDPDTVAFINSVMNGLMLEKSLSLLPVSVEAQSVMIAAALKAAQDKGKS